MARQFGNRSAPAGTHIVGTESVSMLLVIRIGVDRLLRVSLAIEQLSHHGCGLLEVALVVCRWMIGAWEAGGDFGRVRSVVLPADRPAILSGEIGVGGVPI